MDAGSLIRSGICISKYSELESTKTNIGTQRLKDSYPKQLSVPLKSEFKGSKMVVSDHILLNKSSTNFFAEAQSSNSISKSMRWWEKTLKHNIIKIHSAQELVDTLLNAGDKLVVIDFYSPGCGGCRALHPKICQIADLNQNAIFLKVNYEELSVMCTSLNIPVLPFFRFYRGAEGRLCSFSCTNATIKKFKDALEKHGTDRCSLGPAKGLEEAELLRLASNKEISFNSSPTKYEKALHHLFETNMEDYTSSIIQR
ncbi:hypothetical protein C5167_005887 [Papaver somniferum]|uniref:Thioredoxin domain-containing protein n=1 Tax=Papaver somniferum TaxID=3469 RepID=A0A4Y7JFR0_PAPSO|nr:thioredoxin-like 1-2, chloroplastic [Papaver somniferum]RZC58589.1 hypothetical protein C5167_005887 [Papaver somniferum]